jgi:hypothetical protein
MIYFPHLPHHFRTTAAEVRKPRPNRSAAPLPNGVRGCGAVMSGAAGAGLPHRTFFRTNHTR